MSEQIKKSDISEKDIYGYIIESAKIAEKQVKELNDELIKSAKIQKDSLKNNKFQNSADVKKGSEAIKEANRLKAESNRLDKISGLTKKQMQSAEQALQKQREKGLATMKKEADSYNQLSKKARDLKNESKRLGAELLHLEQSGKRNTKEFALLTRQYKQTTSQAFVLDGQLKKLDSSVGDNQRNVGNYGSAITKLRGGLAQLGLAFGVFQIARSSFNTIVEFEQGTANLASVLGTTSDKVKALTDDAKRLGASTIFTATEVANLQTEFAKLGFTESEILKVTEGTLSLASATGTDLARAAEVAGSTLRGFGLDADQTNRVTDVMASSFSKSALDMEKFAESMKFVAPIAKVAGISIEETTAMLGALANAGISGSNAGTALRQVISQMDKTGKSTSEALKDLAKEGLNLADAEGEVGKNAKTALLVLTDQTKQTEELTKAFENAEGSAEAMAKTQRETLGGSVKLLTSAFDGMILGMNEAGGVGDKLRKVFIFLAENLGTIFSVIGKAIVAIASYKTLMVATRVVQTLMNKELRQSIFSFKDLGKATNEAGAGASKMAGALRGIGFTVAIGLAFEFARELYSIASGAKQAEEDLARLNKQIAKGQELGDKRSTQRQKELQQELDLAKTEEEKIAIIKKTETQIRSDISAVDKRKTAYKRDILALKELEKQYKSNEISFEDYAKKIEAIAKKNKIEGDESWVSFLTGEKDIATANNILPQLEANLAGANEKVKIYKGELNDLTHTTKVLNKEIDDNSKAEDENTKATSKSTKTVKEKIKVVKELKSAYDQLLAIEKEEADFNEKRLNNQIELGDAIDEANRELRLSQLSDEEREIEETKENYRRKFDLAEAYGYGREELEIQLNNELKLIRKKYAKEEIKDVQDIEKKKFENYKEFIDLSADYFIKRSEDKIAQLDKEIDASQKQFDNLQELANQGNITAQQSLAEQQRIINEANAKKIAEQKRIERIKLAETAFSVYSSKLEAGDKNPLLSTIKDVTLLNQFISSLPAFEDGTENTGTNGKGVDGKGGFHALLHPNERVMTKEQNALVGDLTNSELSRIASDYNNGKIVNLNASASAGNSYDLIPLLSEIKSLKKTIQERPTHNIAMGEITQSIMQIVEKTTKGNRVERKIYNIRK